MSEIQLSQKIERTCEGCGKKQIFEMINPTDSDITAMMEWFTILRHVIDAETGRPAKLMAQACSLPCIAAVGLKMAIVPGNPPDNIDLETLRAGDMIQ